MFNHCNDEDSANLDMQFFIIPNGSDECDNISDCEQNIPDKHTNEENMFIKDNPYKDIGVNVTELNVNTKEKDKNLYIINQSEQNDEQILSPDQLILNTFTSFDKPQELERHNLMRYYFQEYNSKFKRFLTEYANNLFRKHLLCGKIQKPRVSLFKFIAKNRKKKDKSKLSSFTMKKMLCFHKIKNKKIIKRILGFIKKFDSNKKYEYIKSFLSSKIGDATQKFEQSEKFVEFISDTKIIWLDKEIKKEKGFSILEKNAYEKMVKIQRDMKI